MDMLTAIICIVGAIVYLYIESSRAHKRELKQMERYYQQQHGSWEAEKQMYHELHINNENVFNKR